MSGEVVENDPRFEKIWPGYARENPERNSIKPPKNSIIFRKFLGRTKKKKKRGEKTGTGMVARRKHDNSAGAPLQRLCDAQETRPRGRVGQRKEKEAKRQKEIETKR